MKTLKELQKIEQSSGKMTLAKYLKAAELREKLNGLKQPAVANRSMKQITIRHIQDCADPIVICLTGAKGAGKTTVADWYIEQFRSKGYVANRRAMAEPLKDVAYTMGWNGEKGEKGRRLLQLLGTECGRECISKDIWTNAWYEAATEAASKVTIIDDCRFDDEYEVTKRYAEEVGAKFYHINLHGRTDGTQVDNRNWLMKLLFKFKPHKSEAGISYTTALQVNTSKCHIEQSKMLWEQMINE